MNILGKQTCYTHSSFDFQNLDLTVNYGENVYPLKGVIVSDETQLCNVNN